MKHEESHRRQVTDRHERREPALSGSERSSSLQGPADSGRGTQESVGTALP